MRCFHASDGSNVSEYINGVFTGAISHDQHMPAGLRLYLP